MGKLWMAALLLAWAGAAGVGFCALSSQAGQAGAAAEAPERWPADTSIPRQEGRAIVVMIAHPHCACTRASLAELDRLMSRTTGRVDGVVVMSRIAAGEPRGDLYTLASRIEGVRVVEDPSGQIARQFGAKTSGQVFVYEPKGSLVFTGGITAARGHEGDNGGETSALRAALGESTRSPASGAPKSWVDVFGCALFGREERP